MPLQQASPRLPAPRYHPSKPRRALSENIERLFGMFTVMGALQASTQMLLAVAPSASMVMVTTHQQIVLNAFSYGVLHLAQEAVSMYFQRRQLGAESSGRMLAGAARGHRGPPPKASDWGDALCFNRTRFTVVQIHLLLLGLGMMRTQHIAKVSCVPKQQVVPQAPTQWPAEQRSRQELLCDCRDCPSRATQ